MTDDEFRELLDRHGGNLERWPCAHLQDARLLLARSVTAQAMLDEMVTMEQALSAPETSVPEHGPPPGLADRIFDLAFGADSQPEATGADAPATRNA